MLAWKKEAALPPPPIPPLLYCSPTVPRLINDLNKKAPPPNPPYCWLGWPPPGLGFLRKAPVAFQRRRTATPWHSGRLRARVCLNKREEKKFGPWWKLGGAFYFKINCKINSQKIVDGKMVENVKTRSKKLKTKTRKEFGDDIEKHSNWENNARATRILPSANFCGSPPEHGLRSFCHYQYVNANKTSVTKTFREKNSDKKPVLLSHGHNKKSGKSLENKM